MKTIFDYQREIISELKENEYLTIHELKKRIEIPSYQERSNFLEALYNLELKEGIYNIRKGTYTLFPKDLYKVDYVIPISKGLYLKRSKVTIDETLNKGKIILPDDIVVVTNEENPKIKRTIGRSMYFFKNYLLKELEQKNLTYKQIKTLAIARNKQKITELKDLLHTLEKEGKIYCQGKTFEKWPNNLALTKLETDSNNKLYFVLDNKRYYKEKEELNNALDGDIIAVSRKGKHIVKIIERTKEELILEVVEIKGVKQLEPILLPGKGKIKVRISSNDMKHLKIGDRIKARISLNETDGVYEADYINTIGNIKDNDIDLISIAAKHGFNIEFSDEALREARNIPQTVNINDYKDRYDFTKRFKTFTIDCDNTKDMDDAVSIMKNEKGNYILAVHIAHVSHYVKRGSALNKEAYERALSAYPANSVIPNLPPELSNGICSLNPNVPRLTRTCIMEISKTGELLNYKFVNSIIESKKKMSYSEVNKVLDEGIVDDEYLPFLNDLTTFKELSDILTLKRKSEGMLTFIEHENNFIEDKDGNIISIEEKNNGTAGKMIENAMILYNYCESSYLNFIIGTSINRVHDSPDQDKLMDAFDKIHNLGHNLPKIGSMTTAQYIQTILNMYQNENDYPIISDIILKALPRAHYSIYPTGHFGLGLDFYTHSTSPIRRYPDLKAQQIIDSYEQGKLYEIEDNNTLEAICEHCSMKEQEAEALEREVELIKMLKYVERHKDKNYYGIITDIDNERAYLKTITNIPGYIEYLDLDDIRFIKSKRYLKDENDMVVLKIGDTVKVQTHNTNHKELLVDFDFIKNITLEQQNKKGATALRKSYIKRLY